MRTTPACTRRSNCSMMISLSRRDDDMRVGFLKRWTMIDSLAYANSIT